MKSRTLFGVRISMVDSDYEPKDDQQGYHLSFYYRKVAVATPSC